MNSGNVKEARSTGTRLGPDFVSAIGPWLITVDGNRYFDATAGSGAISLGHQHPIIVEACHNQIDRLIHTGCKLGSDVRTKLAEKISELTPFEQACTLFCVIGTEAAETAFKIVRAKTGRKKIAGLEYAFHGKSSGALTITWRNHFKKYSFIDSSSSVIVPACDLSTPQAVSTALNDFREQLTMLALHQELPAGLIFEPIQVTEGVRIFPIEYIDGLLSISKEFGILSIIDEIYTGMGRCGKLFFSHYLTQKPDLILLGKSLGNGLPISLVVGEKSLINILEPGVQTSTYSGHPVSCAAALAVCQHVTDTQLWKVAEERGSDLAQFIRAEMVPAGFVGEVRQKGMLIGFDFYSTDIPAAQLCRRFIEIALQNNVLLFGGGALDCTVKLVPPIELSNEELFFLKTKLRQTLLQLKEEVSR